MQTKGVKSNQEILKNLKKKAELCRYAHSELKERYINYRNWKEFIVLIVSVLIVALLNLHYRKVLDNDFILIVLWSLPLVVTILQGLDCTIFHWTNKIAKHESAVTIWGHWIREADFLEKNINSYETNVIKEKMYNMQERYTNCMNSTAQIPNNKFLKYKERFKVYVLKSKEIDKMSLNDVAGTNKYGRK